MAIFLFFLTGVVGVTILCLGRYIGEKGSGILSVCGVWLTLGLDLYYFLDVLKNGKVYLLEGPTWFRCGLLEMKWTFLIDSLTVVMLLVICLISGLVHLYSLNYMEGDPHLSRFLAYLSLFTFFMVLLVSSNNFLQLFIGWEGVGLCSFLLINFWFTRKQANKSALKAMVLNRIGDVSLVLSFCLIYWKYKSLDFSLIFLLTPYLKDAELFFYGINYNYISIICLFLLIGAIGKSAQVGLHLWLPDAMEGPTPVSALIHAATMVTAGVFLVVRCSILFEYSVNILYLISVIGAVTSLFAASTGLFQNDLKKVIAYSTCSQLGYMFLACGMSGYEAAMFHLFTHAFFKALLFLGAGGIIHSIGDEQDMRKMGGLVLLMPFTYTAMLIGSLSLMGFPFLSGFYSKEWILELAVGKGLLFPYSLGVLSTFLTAVYSIRLLYLVFLSFPRANKLSYSGVHEVPLYMGLSFLVLVPCSVFAGYLFRELFIGLGSGFWNNSIFVNYENLITFDAEFTPFYIKLIPLFFGLFGSIISYILHKYLSIYLIVFLKEKGNIFLIFFNSKWLFDELANKINYFFLKEGYRSTFKGLDRGYFEIIGPTGISIVMLNLSMKLKNLHSGYLYHYLGLMSLSLVFFLTLLVFNVDISTLFFLLSIICIKQIIKDER